MSAATASMYQHCGVALLRSAVAAVEDVPGWWPDPVDAVACRRWLSEAWARPGFAEAIRLASPTLAHRVKSVDARQALLAVIRSRSTR